MNQMAFLFTMALLPGALATLNAPAKASQDNEAKVNFEFMTGNHPKRDYYKPGEKAGVLGGITGFFKQHVMKDRPANSPKKIEEIVKSHYCQEHGKQLDETYYASSFCYWMPDSPAYTKNTVQQESGLYWSRGEGTKLQAFPPVSTQNHQGKCVKYSYCHNNARGKGGEFHASGFIEEIEVGDCKTESGIDTLCQDEFNTNAGKELKTQQDKCKEVEDASTQAVAKHAECLKKIDLLSEQIDAIPGRITQAEKNIEGLTVQMDKAKKDHPEKRNNVHRRCNDYFLVMTPAKSNPSEIMGGKEFECNFPPPHEQPEKMEAFNTEKNSCNACKQAFDGLKEAVKSGDKTSKDLEHARLQPAELRKEKDDNENKREEEKRTAIDLQAVEETTGEAWKAQEAGCRDTYDQYETGKAGAVAECAPKHYVHSCELSCLQKQTSAGGGVVEGLPKDGEGKFTALGGVELECMPRPSWIRTPFTPSSSDAEIPKESNQCHDLEGQEVQYALTVLKEGWLSKESTWRSKFQKVQKRRYFVLESGDEVRSAVLRYFEEEPKAGGASTERGAKGIILQDAKSVSVDDEKCFTLVHFYRTYHFCVEGSDTAEDWVKNIRPNIGSSSE